MLTDQQIDEFLELLAKSPTSARDMVRGLFAAHEAKAEPFGYFRAEPLGWTDCAADDEGAIALYERPAAPAVPQGWKLVPVEMTDEMRDAGNEFICNRYLLKSAYTAMLAATPAAPSQPVTLTDEYVASHLEAAGVKLQRFKGGISGKKDCWSTSGSQDVRKLANGVRAIIAALREKERAK